MSSLQACEPREWRGGICDSPRAGSRPVPPHTDLTITTAWEALPTSVTEARLSEID